MDFEIIKRAGLTQKEFAQLCGVSRATVNLWVTGRFRPTRYITAKVQRVIDALATAVATEQLPLPEEVSGTARAEAIEKAMTSAPVAA